MSKTTSSAEKKESPAKIVNTATRYPGHVISYDGFVLWSGACNHCPKDITPWVHQFCSKKQNNWYTVVQNEYALDYFNYYGFNVFIPNLNFAKEMICDRHTRLWSFLTDEDIKAIHDQAKQLYGLLHSKWILTSPGLSQMKKKIFKKKRFGTCLRTTCKGAPLLPVGLSPIPNRHSAKLFCTRCSDVYNPPKNKRFDGAHFGPAFPSVFLVTYPKCDLRSRFRHYEFRMFGFKVHKGEGVEWPHDINNHKNEIISSITNASPEINTEPKTDLNAEPKTELKIEGEIESEGRSEGESEDQIEGKDEGKPEDKNAEEME